MTQGPYRLSVTLLGTPQLLLAGQPLARVRRKNRALIYYLAAHAKSLTRDHLLAFFWPDHERIAAQQILRTMLHDLRKHLGESLRADDETLALAPNTFVDAHDFATTLQAPTSNPHSLISTLDLYRGDFLEGFALADSPQFEDWITTERERYRLLAIRGFTHLARLYENQRHYTAALNALRRALAFDPLQEDLQRLALQLHYLNGDRAGAVRQFELLRKLLDQEMGVPPMPETRALYDAIITDTLTISPPSLLPPQPPSPNPRSTSGAPLLPFIGRADGLQMLQASATSGKLILIVGEPGIGKTRFVDEFLTLQGRQGERPPLVLRGVAYELEQGLPYQPVIDALRNLLVQPEWQPLAGQLNLAPVWLAEVARLLPELMADFPHIPMPAQLADESRLWESLSQFLQALAQQRTVYFFLDDLHWADAATTGWLGYVVRRAAVPSLFWLATARPVEEHAKLMTLLQTLLREDRLTRLSLSALSTSDMHTVAEHLSPSHSHHLSTWLTQNAEGNPFFLTELVRYAYHSNLLQTDGTLDLQVLGALPVLPPTIQNLIQSRLIRLSEMARYLLYIAAVVGREFDFELVRHVAALSENDTLNALEELGATGLIQPREGEQFIFDHSLTMQVVIQDMAEMRRRLLHRQVAEALVQIYQARLDPVAGLIARHFTEGHAPGQAAPYAFRAGQFAASLAAWVEAITFYEQALAIESDEAQHAAIFLAMGAARFHKGDFAQASEDYRTAVRLAQARDDLPTLEAAHLALNQSFLPQARYAEAVAQGEDLHRSGPPELAVCAEFMWGTGLAVESAHPAEAEYHLREAERLLNQQTGFTSRISLADIKFLLAGVMGQQGKRVEAVALYRQALDLVRTNETALNLTRHIMLYNNLAYHLHLMGDPSAADYTRAGIHLAQERGSLSHLPYLFSTSGEIALAQNDLDTAEKYFSEGLSLAEQIPVPERIAGLTANLGLVARQRGQNDLAQQRLSNALEQANQLGTHHLGVRIRIWLAPLLSPSAARQCLYEARSMAEQSGYHRLLDEIKQLEQDLLPS
jgi:DNA-binding SARP family transcriptional activator/Tfp pilus assembly protein PilF